MKKEEEEEDGQNKESVNNSMLYFLIKMSTGKGKEWKWTGQDIVLSN